ncbi:MAG TPA: enoyl-CoA hydratase/isomerase family protein [Acidimicrobiia bacterium]|jgi:enoyl-CoA hydratase/carnithine racemase
MAASGTPRHDDVTVALEDHVATVELHRPPNNYFDVDLVRALVAVVFALDDDPDCRAIVLCSEGKHFCAGADLGPESHLVERTAELYTQAVQLFSAKKPMVAAVQGAAVGGGLGLALAADFRVATPDTRFSCNFAKLGFHQGFGISVTLPAVVGQQRALELLYTGGQVKGAEALAIGLADRLTSPADLRAAAHEMASEIASSAPLSLLAIRRTMRGDLAAKVEEATALEHREQQRLRSTDDFREGVAAMADRRAPRFTAK